MQTLTRRRLLEGSAVGMAAAGWGAACLGAQDWARQAVDRSPRRREWVTVKHEGVDPGTDSMYGNHAGVIADVQGGKVSCVIACSGKAHNKVAYASAAFLEFMPADIVGCGDVP